MPLSLPLNLPTGLPAAHTAFHPAEQSLPLHAAPPGAHIYLVASSLNVRLWIAGGLKRHAPHIHALTFSSGAHAARALHPARPVPKPNLILLDDTTLTPFLHELNAGLNPNDLPLLLLTEQAHALSHDLPAHAQPVRTALTLPRQRSAHDGMLRLLALYSTGQLVP